MRHVRENACPEADISLLPHQFQASHLAVVVLLLLQVSMSCIASYGQNANAPAAAPAASPQSQPTVRIMHVAPFAAPLNGAATITGSVLYWGGPVISNAQLVVVYWGANVSAVVKPSIEPFYQDVTNTTYFDLFNEYSTVGLTGSGGATGSNQTISRGTYGGAFQITPTKCDGTAASCSLTDADIQTELLAQVNAAVLPAPTVDAQGNVNTLYMVYFPPGVTISIAGLNSCQAGGFCAYHSNTSLTNIVNSKTLLYGVMPDFGAGSGCDLGCGAGTQFQNVTSASSHEMGEAVTDPDVGTATAFAPPLAWNDQTNGEIGDVCNQNVALITVGANTYTVQKQWSDLQAACASAPAKLALSSPASANSGTAVNITVTAKNSSGTATLTGYTGTIHFTSSDPLAVLPADFTFTGADAGTHTFSVSLNTSGAQSVTAQDTRAGVVLGSANITVGSAATHFSVTAPASVNAGTSLQLIVTALDAANSTVTSYAGTVHFTSSDTAAVLPANSTLTNGTGTFSATLKTAGGQTISATDTVTASTTGSASVNVTVSDLTISKTHTGNFTQGQTGAAYTITVSNSGAAPTSGTVSVVDTLPAGLIVHRGVGSLLGTGWTCDSLTLTCTRADALAAGASYPAITLSVDVDPNAPATVTNSVSVSGGGEANTANDTATDPTTIIQVADLTIAKSHTGSFIQGQTGAQYTLTASNVGPGPTSGTVTVTDTLPSGLTATAISGTGWICVLGTSSCTRSDVLAAGAAYPAITLTVDVASTAPATLTNSATVSGGGELNAANDTASDPTTIIQLADLTLSKTHSGTFTQGQAGASYQIIVSNAGAAASSGTVTVVDTLPAGLTATAINGTGWSCVLATLTCTRTDALAINTGYPAITVTVDVAANAPATLTNAAAVSGGGEANTANDTATDATAITQVADLTLSSTHTGTFIQGQTGATYTLTVSNAGPGATSGTVTVVDALPAGLTATSIAGSGWTCVPASLTCTRSDALQANGGYPAITVTVNVAANASASVTNTATVSGGAEINTANDAATDVTTIVPPADLTITKIHNGTFSLGQTGATYTIAVANSGQGPTAGTVSVVDNFPASGLTATAISGTGWTCVLATLTCTRADVLAAGASYPGITVTVNIALNAPSPVNNAAAVSGGGELNTSNDAASDSASLAPPASLVASGSSSATVAAGSAASFSFSFTSNQATAVNFSCSGLPSAAACSFNPSSTNSTSAQVAMTISTTASSGTLGTRWNPRGPDLYFPVLAMLGGLLLLPMMMRRKLALRWGLGWAGLMLVLALAGCGGSPTPPPHVVGTPAGTYQITATATGTGFQTSSVVTLNVR